jgi:predicted Fe-Mo cluster-binding NifX family protein
MNHKIAIAIEEVNTKERIAEHFGRCSKFYICELDEENKLISKESFVNPLAGEQSGTCQLPGYINQFNVNAIIAGGMGQKAISNFLSFGIDVITAPGLLYENALDLFSQGKLSGYEACKHEHNHLHSHSS